MASEPDTTLQAIPHALFAGLAAAVEQIGAAPCPQALASLLQQASGYETTVIATFPESGRPVRLFSNLPPESEESTLRPYFDNTYLLDPWYNMARGHVPDGVYRLADHLPDDFFDSDYYCNYYAATGLRDECGIFVRLGEKVCIVAMLGIRDAAAGKGRLELLDAMLPCLATIIRRHWAGMATLAVTPSENLESICRAHGLAGREIEVTDLLLRGHSNKLIGRELGISHETVKVYRKRINKKLGTTSAREVFAMFFRKG